MIQPCYALGTATNSQTNKINVAEVVTVQVNSILVWSDTVLCKPKYRKVVRDEVPGVGALLTYHYVQLDS